MRFVLTSAAALIFGGFVLTANPTSAPAAPLPSIASLDAASTSVQQIDWRRRYYRQNGVWPPVTVPRAVVEQYDDAVIVEADEPVVRIIPARPVSCGEFHYWDGEHCVDARYNNPYLGPR